MSLVTDKASVHFMEVNRLIWFTSSSIKMNGSNIWEDVFYIILKSCCSILYYMVSFWFLVKGIADLFNLTNTAFTLK